MPSTITVRFVLTCTIPFLLACGEGSGSGQDAVPVDAAETSVGDELMNQAEQDRRVDYIEFLTTNMEETKKFYAEVFGWEFTDYGPDYSSFTDGRLAGGFSVAPDVAAGGPLVVLYATNLEVIETSISESGGKIVREIFEFPGGRRFHFTDPSGNELAVWSDR
jgi:predicted enzyme related to lactoylglutathione lyase